MREAEVRALLTRRLVNEHSDGTDTLIIPELGLCQATARIDIAVINGAMTGWEIKTERDTLKRLPAQAEVYSRVFDRVWLAAAERHIEQAASIVPEWWGVVRIPTEEGKPFVTVRRAKLNRGIDPQAIVRLLWRTEAYEELDRLGLANGMARAPRTELWDRLASACPAKISRAALRSVVRDRLRDRADWRSDLPRR